MKILNIYLFLLLAFFFNPFKKSTQPSMRINNTITVNTSFRTKSFPQEKAGEKLYIQFCLRCHGLKGNEGFPKAKKLTKNKRNNIATINIIQKGKQSMPPFEKTLTELEIKMLAEYIKHFKK